MRLQKEVLWLVGMTTWGFYLITFKLPSLLSTSLKFLLLAKVNASKRSVNRNVWQLEENAWQYPVGGCISTIAGGSYEWFLRPLFFGFSTGFQLHKIYNAFERLSHTGKLTHTGTEKCSHLCLGPSCLNLILVQAALIMM